MLHRRGRWTTLVATDGFTVGVLEVGRREKRSRRKDRAKSEVGTMCPVEELDDGRLSLSVFDAKVIEV